MTGRKLPPLLAGACYTGPQLGDVDFTPPELERELKGEATAVLRLTLANEVSLAFPLRAFQLQMLMSGLMRAFPQQALANIRFCAEQEDGNLDGPGRTHGAGKH